MKELNKNNEHLQDLIKVQSAITNLTNSDTPNEFYKSQSNPFYKSKYLPLSTILKEINPILNANNFLLCQQPKIDDHGREVLVTRLIHSSGEEINCTAPLKIREEKDRNDPQKYGSALTYMRRYSIVAILGIVEDDDDGNKASCKDSVKDSRSKNFFKEKTTEIANISQEDEIDTVYNFLQTKLHQCNNINDLENFKKSNKKYLEKLKRISIEGFNKIIEDGLKKKKEFEAVVLSVEWALHEKIEESTF